MDSGELLVQAVWPYVPAVAAHLWGPDAMVLEDDADSSMWMTRTSSMVFGEDAFSGIGSGCFVCRVHPD